MLGFLAAVVGLGGPQASYSAHLSKRAAPRMTSSAGPQASYSALLSKRAASRMTASDGERIAIEQLASVTSLLTRFGLDSGDKDVWDRLASAVGALEEEIPLNPQIAADVRLVGDWQLIGCTSLQLISRKGLTGLGAAPFTNLGALHCSFTADGRATARETLEFFGRPVILNELRGSVSFSEEGDDMQVCTALCGRAMNEWPSCHCRPMPPPAPSVADPALSRL